MSDFQARRIAWVTRKQYYGPSGDKCPLPHEETPWSWLRLQIGLSQEQFAVHIGAQRSSVHEWEARRNLPTSPYLVAMIRVAKAQGIDKSFLLRLLAYEPLDTKRRK